MYVRLGFAVAAHLDPEVLLLDEVLAVGDTAFQQKCLRRIDELTQSGRTVLFVSHTPASVAQLCHRAIVINGGRIVFEGDVDGAIQEYLGSPQIDGSASATEQEARQRDGIRRDPRRRRPRERRRRRPDRARPADHLRGRPRRAPRDRARNLALDVGIWSATSGQPITLSTRYESDDPRQRPRLRRET